MTPSTVVALPEVAAPPGFALPRELRGVRMHMIGIAGSGMCGLAAFLLRDGARVSGTDLRPCTELAQLAQQGADVCTDQSGAALPPDVEFVVRSAAIGDEHPEVREARRRGLPVIKYAEMLGALMARCDGIAISGTHGKSTTTAWLTFVLRQAGLDPSFVVGASVEQLGGGSGAGAGPHFIAEACEYDRSFLNLRPRRAAVLNIDEDHLDSYPNLGAIARAFAEFAGLVPADGLLVLNGDDPWCHEIAKTASARVQTCGFGRACDWRATAAAPLGGRYEFTVTCRERRMGRVALGIPGRHNISNALAVIALASDCGVGWEVVAAALAEFRGARRRLELRGEVNGVRVVDDYAHHPTEIQATLGAARERYAPRRLWCVFQPHQHSRTRFLLAQFAESFSLADHVVVPDIYFVRDSQRERDAVCAQDLVDRLTARGDRAEYLPAFADIVERIARAVQPGDVVLTMGAGDIWTVADGLLRRLRGNLPD